MFLEQQISIGYIMISEGSCDPEDRNTF